ncbi:MAG: histidine kinase, partial [Acidobacteriota bacterium]
LLFLGIALLVAVQNHQGALTSGPPDRVPTLLVFFQIEALVWGSWWSLLPFVRFGLNRLRRLRSEGLWLWIVAVSVLGLVTSVLSMGVMALFQEHVWWLRPVEGPLIERVIEGTRRGIGTMLLIFASIAGVLESLHLLREERARIVREAALRADLAEARLEGLQARLQPHFLFNSMNAVASLMGRDVEAARQALGHLSGLLRGLLDDGPDDPETTLRDELDLLDHYLELLRLRFSDRLRLSVSVEQPRLLDAWVPRLVLQPLVENAVVHGIEACQDAGRIEVVARAAEGRLVLAVEDDGPGPPEELREGLGIGTTRARLEALYPGASSLRLSVGQDGGARVEVTLPLETD